MSFVQYYATTFVLSCASLFQDVSSSSVGPSQSKSCFSGAIKHAQTCNFSPFIFVYHYNEFTMYFTDKVCKNNAHACATSDRPPSLERPA